MAAAYIITSSYDARDGLAGRPRSSTNRTPRPRRRVCHVRVASSPMVMYSCAGRLASKTPPPSSYVSEYDLSIRCGATFRRSEKVMGYGVYERSIRSQINMNAKGDLGPEVDAYRKQRRLTRTLSFSQADEVADIIGVFERAFDADPNDDKDEYDALARAITDENKDVPLILHNRVSGTMLILACNSRKTRMVKLLLSKGADPNAGCKYSGRYHTPLKLTIEGFGDNGDGTPASRNIFDMLIEANADVNLGESAKTNKDLERYPVHPPEAGMYPLHIAAMRKDPYVVRILIERGADKRAMNGDKRMAFQLVHGGDYVTIKTLNDLLFCSPL